MRNRSIRCALGGAICLLMAGFFAGCEEPAPTKTPPGSGKSPATSAAASSAAKAVAAADSTTSKPSEAAAESSAPKAVAETHGVAVAAADECRQRGDCRRRRVRRQRRREVPNALTGQPLADSLMDDWKRNHPQEKWVTEEEERHTLKPPADNAALLQGEQGKGDTYGNFTKDDLLTWQRETEKFAAEGSKIFHSGDELGSTAAVSCDMCHPHAANTHPETYPKFQVQLGRVVLLRDMINWCIENPVRGKKLDPDGAKMRALEAYIMAQRKGVPMDYGKH